MPHARITANVDRHAWRELRTLADESHRSVSDVLTEAIREYVARRRVRPDVLGHLKESMREHAALGRRLAE